MTNPYAPPTTFVEDIAEPQTGVEFAERSTRLGAAILDGVIFFAMVYLPFVIAAIAGTSSNANAIAVFGGVLGVLGLIAWAWLTILYVKRNGQSIAKKFVGIKVVRADGSAVSLSRIFWLRNVLNAVMGMIPLYVFVDALFIFSESQQCLHDKIADTIVVKA